MRPIFGIILLFLYLLTSCKKDSGTKPEPGSLQLISINVGSENLSLTETNTKLPFDQPIVIRFSQPVNKETIENNILLLDGENSIESNLSYLDEDKTISILPLQNLDEGKTYTVKITNGIQGKNNEKFPGFTLDFSTLVSPLEIVDLNIDGKKNENGLRIVNVKFKPTIKVAFSEKVDESILENHASILLGSLSFGYEIDAVSDSVFLFNVIEDLPYYRKIRFSISESLSNDINKDFEGLTQEFYTQLDSTNKFSEISDEELLTLVQQQTFKYFWDFGHPMSGLSRERNTSSDNVTSGGSGFGIMTIPVGIERGFITHSQGVERVENMVDFLGNADRFHGAWSHWLSGSTGKVNPFSANDDGGDLVETSYMAMGLITVRQYLDSLVSEEKAIIDKINTLLDEIEWDWYTQGENSLTWHWSPNYEFEKNHKIRGWNEALITYVMAASSKTHPISKEVYEQGWGTGTNMINGKEFYGITLPLGRDLGGPLFFEQYTFLGLDPRNLRDQYANYWEQAVNHTRINREYCITNPQNYVGYSEDCWGLTASDGNNGYSAHAPNNDRGVISPTAAISSIPFTPEESMDAIRHFYYMLGDRLWGQYGFYDAFNVTANWYATSNIAIDQGPILLMIENYRTGLLWELFMSAPEIQNSLTKLGFTY